MSSDLELVAVAAAAAQPPSQSSLLISCESLLGFTTHDSQAHHRSVWRRGHEWACSILLDRLSTSVYALGPSGHSPLTCSSATSEATDHVFDNFWAYIQVNAVQLHSSIDAAASNKKTSTSSSSGAGVNSLRETLSRAVKIRPSGCCTVVSRGDKGATTVPPGSGSDRDANPPLSSPLQVDPYCCFPVPTLTLLCLHPNESLRRWATEVLLSHSVQIKSTAQSPRGSVIAAYVIAVQLTVFLESFLSHLRRVLKKKLPQTLRKSVSSWMADLVCDVIVFVNILEAHMDAALKKGPSAKSEAVDDDDDTKFHLPPQVPHFATSMLTADLLVELLFVASWEEGQESFSSCAHEVGVSLAQRLSSVSTHYSPNVCPSSSHLLEMLAKMFIYSTMGDAKRCSRRHLEGDAAADLTLCRDTLWHRSRWSWLCLSQLPPWQRSASNSYSKHSIVSLRDSVLRLSLGNLVKQLQIVQLNTTGLEYCNAPQSGVTSADGAAVLATWKKRAAAGASALVAVTSSFRCADVNGHAIELLSYQMSIHEHCQPPQAPLVTLSQVMTLVGTSSVHDLILGSSLNAGYALLFQLLACDVVSAFRVKDPSLAGNIAAWKLVPSLLKQLITRKRDAEGAVKVCLILLWSLFPSTDWLPSTDVVHWTPIYVATDVASTRPALSSMMIECVADVAEVLGNNYDMLLRHVVGVVGQQQSAAGGVVVTTIAKKETAMCPLFLVPDGIHLLKELGRLARIAVRCQDPKIARLGQCIGRLYGERDVVRVDEFGWITRQDAWTLEGAAQVWERGIMAQPPLQLQAATWGCLSHARLDALDNNKSGLLTREELREDDDEDKPLVARYDSENASAIGNSSTPGAIKKMFSRMHKMHLIPPCGSQAPLELMALARAQLRLWMTTVTDIVSALVTSASTTHISLPLYVTSVVFDVLSGANSTASERAQYLQQIVVRLCDAYYSSTQTGDGAREQPIIEGTEVQVSVIGLALVYTLLSKASLFTTDALLSALLALPRVIHPHIAAVFLSEGATVSGVPPRDRWLVAMDNLWRQLPATDRMVLKRQAQECAPWLKKLIDAAKEAVDNASKMKEAAFAQFDLEDMALARREEFLKRLADEEAAKRAENKKKDNEEREAKAALRREAYSSVPAVTDEATAKRPREAEGALVEHKPVKALRVDTGGGGGSKASYPDAAVEALLTNPSSLDKGLGHATAIPVGGLLPQHFSLVHPSPHPGAAPSVATTNQPPLHHQKPHKVDHSAVVPLKPSATVDTSGLRQLIAQEKRKIIPLVKEAKLCLSVNLISLTAAWTRSCIGPIWSGMPAHSSLISPLNLQWMWSPLCAKQ